jgi:hypothetical protein
MKDLLTEEGEISLVNGDFATGEADGQHIEDILLSAPGDYLNSPLTGVRIRSALNGPENSLKIKQRIRTQLQADGFQIKALSVKGSTVSIDAKKLR